MWRDAWAIDALVATVSGVGPAGDEVLTLTAESRSGCVSLRARRRSSADGSLRLDRLVTALGAERFLNVVATVRADYTGDGYLDAVVEVRGYDSSLGSASYTPYSSRDVTPDVERAGRVLVVDGRTGAVVDEAVQRRSLGPGPVAGSFRRGGDNAVAILTNVTADATSATAEVAATTRRGVAWRRRVPTLPDGGDYLAVGNRPAFVTGTLVPRSPEPHLPPFALTYERTRLTVLDPRDGSVRWERTWLSAGNRVSFSSLGDDVLVEDGRLGEVARLRGGDGSVVWSVRYADLALRDTPPLADYTGDGVPDDLVLDSAPSPLVVSGADGALTPLPLVPLPAQPFPVGDLDGDGAADVVVATGAQGGVGVPLAAAAGIVAYSGRTGMPLWQAPLGPGQGALEMVSADVDGAGGDELFVYRLDEALLSFDGRTGTERWLVAV
ncbi:MAG TPA: hypothetical protein VGX28_09660 [Frankiaceae bacterium]|nr:hypothetical protein [Frankiaceae bacterium]